MRQRPDPQRHRVPHRHGTDAQELTGAPHRPAGDPPAGRCVSTSYRTGGSAGGRNSDNLLPRPHGSTKCRFAVEGTSPTSTPTKHPQVPTIDAAIRSASKSVCGWHHDTRRSWNPDLAAGRVRCATLMIVVLRTFSGRTTAVRRSLVPASVG